MGVGHHGMCICGENPSAVPAEETLFVAFMLIVDSVPETTIRSIWLRFRIMFSQHYGSSIK